MPAGFAKVAVRRSGPCSSGAGHTCAASPKQTVRAIAASKPRVVQLAGSSKAQPGAVSRVARAQSRGPALTVVARSAAVAPKAVLALGASLAVQGKLHMAARPAADTRSLPKVALRQAPPVGAPKAVSAKRLPPHTPKLVHKLELAVRASRPYLKCQWASGPYL